MASAFAGPRAALKEGGPALAPPLLSARLFLAVEGFEQNAGQGLGIQGVGPGRCDQLAELHDLARLQSLSLNLQRSKLSVDIAGFAHLSSPSVPRPLVENLAADLPVSSLAGTEMSRQSRNDERR